MPELAPFIAIEGTDGTGKATQAKALAEKIQTEHGLEAVIYSYPRYDQPIGGLIGEILKQGVLGPPIDLPPKLMSMFYATDRGHDSPQLRSDLESGKVVIADRYTSSSLAHQGSKLSNPEERLKLYGWIEKLEQDLGCPKPDLNIILKVPAEVAIANVGNKGKRTYTDGHDLVEEDEDHQATTLDIYEELARLFPERYSIVDCMDGSKMKTIEAIQGLVIAEVEPVIAEYERLQ